MATGESGWQHLGCRRHGGKRGGLRATGRESRFQHFPQDPVCGAAGEWDTCVVGRPHGSIRHDELTLAAKVIPSLRKEMLCMADQFFPSYKLWRMAAKTGADLLWRTRQNARLDVEKRWPDGSYFSRIYASTSDRRNGIVVRVIEYRLKDVEGAEPLYRLITTILDHEQAPGQGTASSLSRTMGNRNHLGRIEDTFTRGSDCVAQQDAGLGPAGVFRSADGAFCRSRLDARSCAEGR